MLYVDKMACERLPRLLLGVIFMSVLTKSLVSGGNHEFINDVRQVRNLNLLSDEFFQTLVGPGNEKLPWDLEQLVLVLERLVVLLNVGNSSLVHKDCQRDVTSALEALKRRQAWVLRMLDAIGKPPSGLMNPNLQWLGDYDECVSVLGVHNTHPRNHSNQQIRGRYCMTSMPVDKLLNTTKFRGVRVSVGVCVPDTCDDKDTRMLVKLGLNYLNVTAASSIQPEVTCQTDEVPYDNTSIAVIVVCAVFATLLVLGTLYEVLIVGWLGAECQSKRVEDLSRDRYGSLASRNSVSESLVPASGNQVTDPFLYGSTQPNLARAEKSHVNTDLTNSQSSDSKRPYVPGAFGKTLLCFSVYTNVGKILTVTPVAGSLQAVHGIRFLSMTWVILGHVVSGAQRYSDNALPFSNKLLHRWTFQAVANSTFSVDSFFTISGLLVAYVTFRAIKACGSVKRFPWFKMFYFHRYWRLTPPYMLWLMLYVPLFKHWSSGPFWPQDGIEEDECKTTWWWNLLYINNVAGTRKSCMGWSWYLANDMQFFVISPILLIPLYYSGALGTLVCLVLLLGCLISTGMVSAHGNVPADLRLMKADDKTMEDALTHMYDYPWHRVGPYIVGLYTGYLLYRCQCKVRLSRAVSLGGWMLSAGIALSVLYGLYDPDSRHPLSTNVSAFYNATSRTAWGIAVSWVIYACATGYGGIVDRILSWGALVPLSRLTYCAYLVHPVVLDVFFRSRRALIHFSDIELVHLQLGNLWLSYATAFCVSLAFEVPMMGLEKLITGRDRSS